MAAMKITEKKVTQADVAKGAYGGECLNNSQS